MDQRTHEKIAPHLCGRPVELGARLTMEATAEMAADSRGLVHGGFTFGLTDHAAMLAVNEPTVVHILDVNASKEPRR
jgi:acyl-coenzyme A thioesterase PaaI-like protein